MNKKTDVRNKMSDERKSTVFLAVLLVLTLAVGIISVTGMPLDGRGLYKLKAWVPSLNAANWPSSIPLAMDLGGGTYTEYQAAVREGSDLDLNAAMDSTVSILSKRLQERGYLAGTVSRAGDDRVRVEIANTQEKDELLSLLSAGGNLAFSFPDGVFLEGNHIKSAKKETNSTPAQPVVRLTLDAQGTKALADASAAHEGEVLTVTLDGETLVSGTLESAIYNGELFISGLASQQAARNVAIILRSGALPVQLAEAGTGDVPAGLGGVLQWFMIAGLVLLVAAVAVLAARYLLGGLAAFWALWIDIILTFFLLAVFPDTQLTLLGLLGIALGTALFVAVSALLLEKFAQGLRPGRLHKPSVHEGWREIRGKVWKIHGICIAVSLVLLILPIGFLRSFAVTALAGTVSSLLTTWIATRALLYHMAGLVKKEPGRFARARNV